MNSRDEIVTEILKHQGEITAHRTEIVDQQRRIDELINMNNAATGEIRNEIGRHREEMSSHREAIVEQQAQMIAHKSAIEQQASHAATALNETAAKLFHQVDELIATMRNETSTNFNEMAKRVELMVEGAKAQMGKEGALSGGDRERASGSGGKGIDKKDVSVRKLPEDLDRMAFRHWSDAIDVNL